ncbi:hypothetical protein An12g09220 [Aspergillus niger]|uniref:Uncharacterized protein n=2 Tax=Aspergillus niger TaxID=5061 RepID=A2R0N5_ASPNC|nr:hypothetical protein An12g09220 [Aspergillus niger]CAK41352.1 hypothetical protein An12g09220 [Aspergillus niger]
MRSYWKLGGSSEEWDSVIGISSSSDRGSIPRSEPGSQERTGDLGRGMEEADQGPFAFDGEWVFLRKCIGMRAGTQCPDGSYLSLVISFPSLDTILGHLPPSHPQGRRMFHWWISPSSYTQVILPLRDRHGFPPPPSSRPDPISLSCVLHRPASVMHSSTQGATIACLPLFGSPVLCFFDSSSFFFVRLVFLISFGLVLIAAGPRRLAMACTP